MRRARARRWPSRLPLLVAGCGGDSPPPVTTDAAPPVERLRIIFPEGLNVREMGDRVAAVRKIAIAKRGVTPKLTRKRYLDAVAQARPPKPFLKDWKRGSMEGFLFPALYEFTQFTSGSELVSDQLTAFRKAFARVDLSYARSKNLTPYDVLKIASMIEKETVAPRERKLVSAVIYNRLRNKMPLGIDATHPLRPGHPGHEVADEVGDPERQPLQQPALPGPAAHAGRESRASPRSRPPRIPAKVDYLYYVRIPGHEAALLHGERERVPAQGVRVRLRLQLRQIRRGLGRLVGDTPP